MKNKKILALTCLVLTLVLLSHASAEVKKIESLGQYTFARVRGKIPTPEVMKMLVERYSADIQTGFVQAGMSDIYQPFIDQLKTAEFEDTTWKVGETVQWMLFRSNGKVKVSGPLEWAGKEPVETFSVKVKVGFKTYTFMIPKPCGNIAYVGMVEEIPEAICSLKVSTAKANINDPITVDMSGSQFAKSLKVEVFDKQGNKIASKDLTPEAAKWQTKLDEPGDYVFKGTAINLADKPSVNSCEAPVYINFPPVATVAPGCTDCKNYYGRPVTFDASGSSDQDGEVTKVSFELKDPDGQVVDSYVDGEKPFTWEKALYKEGTYTMSVTAYDNDGAISAPSSKSFSITRKKLFGMIELGPMLAHGGSGGGDEVLIGEYAAVRAGQYYYDLPDYVAYLFIRPGLFAWLKPDKFSLTFAVGAGIPLKGSPWKALITADLLANLH
ncbi:MAG: hypothetical protein PHU81_04285, partial [Acidobacteriota bacterium]|nr:hypothetical protein [Acidobacteriota bacterium]